MSRLYSPEDALAPLPPAHAHKSLETLRLEFKLLAASESLIAQPNGFFNATIRMQGCEFKAGAGFPYWGVVTEKDIGAYALGESIISPLCPRTWKPRENHEVDLRLARKNREESYAVKSDCILYNMMRYTADPNSSYPNFFGIFQAVNMTIRLADTLSITANRLEKRAMALAAHMRVEVLAEDHRRQQLLCAEQGPWVPTQSSLHEEGFDLLPQESKPKNRLAFEEKVWMAFDGFIKSEEIDALNTVRVSSRLTQVKNMTAEQRQRTGSVYTRSIFDALVNGNTVEGIQLSLELARGLRVSIAKLHEAVDLYFEPVALALAMSQHQRLGGNSLFYQLDIHTLRMIAVICKTGWMECTVV